MISSSSSSSSQRRREGMQQTVLRPFLLFLLTIAAAFRHIHAEGHSIQPLLFPTTTPPTTIIPAFPEESDDSIRNCPISLPSSFFPSITRSCSSPVSRTRCCPTLTAWLYSAYYSSLSSLLPLTTVATDLPVLPDDSEACLGEVEKVMRGRGVVLGKVNESCDVMGCYCGVRLRPLSCAGGFRVEKVEGKLVAVDQKAKMVERDCKRSGINGCSRCLRRLYQIKEGAAGRNSTAAGGGGRIIHKNGNGNHHDRDCQLVALTWLLAKNRTLYLPTVIKVLRAFTMTPDGQDPLSCSLASKGIPLAVDFSEFDDVTFASSSSSSSTSSTFGSYCSCNYVRWMFWCVWAVLVFGAA